MTQRIRGPLEEYGDLLVLCCHNNNNQNILPLYDFKFSHFFSSFQGYKVSKIKIHP